MNKVVYEIVRAQKERIGKVEKQTSTAEQLR